MPPRDRPRPPGWWKGPSVTASAQQQGVYLGWAPGLPTQLSVVLCPKADKGSDRSEDKRGNWGNPVDVSPLPLVIRRVKEVVSQRANRSQNIRPCGLFHTDFENGCPELSRHSHRYLPPQVGLKKKIKQFSREDKHEREEERVTKILITQIQKPLISGYFPRNLQTLELS